MTTVTNPACFELGTSYPILSGGCPTDAVCVCRGRNDGGVIAATLSALVEVACLTKSGGKRVFVVQDDWLRKDKGRVCAQKCGKFLDRGQTSTHVGQVLVPATSASKSAQWETFIECAIMGQGRYRWNIPAGDDPLIDISSNTTISYVDPSNGGSGGGSGGSSGGSNGGSSGGSSTSSTGGSSGSSSGGSGGGGGTFTLTAGAVKVLSNGATCALPETKRPSVAIQGTKLKAGVYAIPVKVHYRSVTDQSVVRVEFSRDGSPYVEQRGAEKGRGRERRGRRREPTLRRCVVLCDVVWVCVCGATYKYRI